jgi:hypothetical protein
MLEAAIREPEQIRQDCALKIKLFDTNQSFRAILACLLGEKWTRPRILELRLTPERTLLARVEGDLTFKRFTATENDLIRSVHKIAKGAFLDGDERGYLLSEILKIKNKRFRGTSDQSGRRGFGE